jgi:hypothetical protein
MLTCSILFKNKRSGQIVDYAKIDRIVKASQAPGGLFYKNMFGRGGGSGNSNKFDKMVKGKGTTTAKGNGNMPSLRARDGEEVGGGAERIGMDNIGHQLLSKMGWADGDRIGRSGGLEAPYVILIKVSCTSADEIVSWQLSRIPSRDWEHDRIS